MPEIPVRSPSTSEEPRLATRLVAEAVGTFVLVFGGVGSAVLAGEHIGFAGVSLAFGLSLLAMVYVVGPVSGCHINPAVTLGLLLRGKIGASAAGGYVVAQIVGAILAAGAVLLIARGSAEGYDVAAAGLGANGYGAHSPDGYGVLSAFFAEIVLTGFLVLTVLRATAAEAPVGFAGIAIGLVLTLVHLVGIPITNTSVNPARSIGPALFVGGWALEQLWLFVVAPLLGAIAAAAVDLALRARPPIPARVAERALPEERHAREAEAAAR